MLLHWCFSLDQGYALDFSCAVLWFAVVCLRMCIVNFFWTKLNWKMQSRSKPSVLQLIMDTVFRARLQQICSKCSWNVFTAFGFTANVLVVWVSCSQHQLLCSTDTLAVHCTNLLTYTRVWTLKPCFVDKLLIRPVSLALKLSWVAIIKGICYLFLPEVFKHFSPSWI